MKTEEQDDHGSFTYCCLPTVTAKTVAKARNLSIYSVIFVGLQTSPQAVCEVFLASVPLYRGLLIALLGDWPWSPLIKIFFLVICCAKYLREVFRFVLLAWHQGATCWHSDHQIAGRM